MSANCGDYGERRGVGICNEFPIAFMPHILWLCASAIQGEHPQGFETDKSATGEWAWAFGWAAILIPSTARFGPFIFFLVLFIPDTILVLIPPFSSSPLLLRALILSLLFHLSLQTHKWVHDFKATFLCGQNKMQVALIKSNQGNFIYMAQNL